MIDPDKLKKAVAWVKKQMDIVDPSQKNSQRFEAEVKSMSPEQLEEWVERLKAGRNFIDFIVPNGMKLDRPTMIQACRDLGHEPYQRVKLVDDHGNSYWTPNKYPVGWMPTRRQSQRLIEKMAVPKSNNVLDDMTNQVTGASKGSSMSQPQLQALYGQGVESSILEMIKFRGGDLKAFNAMNQAIYRNGEVELKEIEPLGGNVRAKEAARNFLLAMHLDNTL